MSTKLIFLMGAPTPQSLCWEEDGLLDNPIFPFSGPNVEDQVNQPVSESHAVKWRLLQDLKVQEQERENVCSEPDRHAIFLRTQDLTPLDGVSSISPDDSVISQFYDHSFAVHETCEISLPGAHLGDSMQESGLSTDSTATSVASSSDREAPEVGSLAIRGCLSDLKDIPSATYLQSIVPQTMTVNLIVGIIAIHPPRRIVTRQWKRELDLVEVVVGDETRTGFGVTFWLPLGDEKIATGRCDMGAQKLRTSLSSLRPRDIVLLRMVGLSSFRERVYGQSVGRGATKVDLLHRQRIDATDAGGIYSTRRLQTFREDETKHGDLPLLMKVCKVREWIRLFVDRAPDLVGGGPLTSRRHGQPLPPDTQE
ncbi:uncharacterized protein NFIA_104680 [Aspergillus fischeri NRRL 181]|uniref:Uncharacterized protein n=1 Tax=Neosartorya fischeri (strain ATCC 1020 / DSM 3700 / CBS 544.65 / FGSC A1164 / JCM 1740 / NRRL 181 / WB 181) TaxID=331117 RepID=A1CWH8_NEOFI|nr:conserved hypothetical protein [Aspergillus fischeri NRRL 181]EAW24980.1 conserved hypothetical protein [Aspergillus fischeri NRRL 181]KAG2027245.1 hypothetical protein GB937_000984 [Aspergillus fischeri]